MRPADHLRSFVQRSRDIAISAAIVGLITGLVVAGCERLTVEVLLDNVRRLPVGVLAAMPVLGLLLAAASLRWIGHGTPAGIADTWLRAFHDRERDMVVRDAPGGVLACIVTIGLGGALGLEGLSMYAGGAIGTAFQQRFKRLFRPADAKLLMTAGAAAGIAAIFKAPATGAVFALEVPFRDDLARRKLLPALVAAAAGYVGFAVVNGTEPLFPVKGTPNIGATALIGAVIVGLGAGLAARAFARLIKLAKRLQTTTPVLPRVLVAGAAMAGLFAGGRILTGRNLMLGPGYDCITWALSRKRAVGALLALMIMRCLATAVTTGGGGGGGLFVPLVVGGALLGRAVAGVFGELDDTLFLVIGVTAFLGAGYRVPLAAVMFVAETTGKAGFVVPGLLAAVAADLMMGRDSVTAYQFPRETPEAAT